MNPRGATCPICRALATAGPAFPFCSERCRTIDLGNWLGGSYRIPTREPADDSDAPPDDGSDET